MKWTKEVKCDARWKIEVLASDLNVAYIFRIQGVDFHKDWNQIDIMNAKNPEHKFTFDGSRRLHDLMEVQMFRMSSKKSELSIYVI